MSLERYRALVPAERGLATVAVRRPDGSLQATVVNTGVLPHPVDGEPVLGFVALGTSRKLDHLRHDPAVTVTIRSGWQWVTAEGVAELAGPDDPHPTIAAAEVPALLREVFASCAATHDDWDEYDRVMAAERRVAVLVRPGRVYGSPGG